MNESTARQFYAGTVLLNGLEIPPHTIKIFLIRQWVFTILPRFEIEFVDGGAFLERFPIVDGSAIRFDIARTADDPNNHHGILHVQDSKIEESANGFKINATGYAHINSMWSDISAVHKGSSSSVLSDIATKLDVEFDNRAGSTDDSMNWYQSSTTFEFLHYIRDRVSIPNDGAFVYLELPEYGNTSNKSKLVLTSLDTEIANSIKYTAKKAPGAVQADNIDSLDSSCVYYNKIETQNVMSTLNTRYGYGMSYGYQDVTTNEYISQSITEPKSLSGTVYRDTDLVGVVDSEKLALYDPINDHGDMVESMVRNRFYRESFFGISSLMVISPLHPIRLFDKIDVLVPSSNGETDGDIVEYLSGVGLVSGITFGVADMRYVKMINISKNSVNFDRDSNITQ